jgi:hypothetical protein
MTDHAIKLQNEIFPVSRLSRSTALLLRGPISQNCQRGSSLSRVTRPGVPAGPAADQGGAERFGNGFRFRATQSPELIPAPLHVRRCEEKHRNIDGRLTIETTERRQHTRFDRNYGCQCRSGIDLREAGRQSDRSAGDDNLCGIGPIKADADADGIRIRRQPPGFRPMGRSVTDDKAHADNRVLARRLGRPQGSLR